jgi:hypothetical protein
MGVPEIVKAHPRQVLNSSREYADFSLDQSQLGVEDFYDRMDDVMSPSAQEAALHQAGAAKVFKEKISGAANHRAQLHRLLKTIDAGDLLIVTRLDRLARSTRDLLNILDQIAQAGATFKSLGDAWADTTTAHGRLIIMLAPVKGSCTARKACKSGAGTKSIGLWRGEKNKA